MEGGGESPAQRVLAPSSSHSESAAAPLAQALDSALAMMMDDRITSLKQYFEEQQAQNEALHGRIAELEKALRGRETLVDAMSKGLESAWDRIEEMEGRMEEVAEGEQLQAKMADIAQDFAADVGRMGDEIEAVRESLSNESAVAAAVEKAVHERDSSERIRNQLLMKQRRSQWLIQTFSAVRFGVDSNLKAYAMSAWKLRVSAKQRQRALVLRAVVRISDLVRAQAFGQWAAVVRMTLKHKLSAEMDQIETKQEAVEARVEEAIASSTTLTRLNEVERTVNAESEETQKLVREFFEYQQKFEVDLAADRLESAAEQRERLAALKLEMRDSLEVLETRLKEELVGCVVRCDTISREIDAARSAHTEADDEIFSTASKIESVGKQLHALQRSTAQAGEAERTAVRRVESKLQELETRCVQTTKEVQLCRADTRAASAAAAAATRRSSVTRFQSTSTTQAETSSSETRASSKYGAGPSSPGRSARKSPGRYTRPRQADADAPEGAPPERGAGTLGSKAPPIPSGRKTPPLPDRA